MYSFSRIYWIDGTSRETMEASIISIASDEDVKSAGLDASSSSVLRWMGRREDNWLIIFDGADVGYEIVEGFIPPGKHGNILISSRNATMNRLASPPSAYMDVLELDENAAIELFTRSALLGNVSPVQRAHVQAIVQELCCLALAVDQAGSSIATGICYIDEYLAFYKRRRRELMDDEFFNGSSNYGRAVYTTWDISFSELERRASSSSSDSKSYETAILLLRIFSFFHFDGIHEEIFRRAAAEVTDQDLNPLRSDTPLRLLLQQTEDNEWDSFVFRTGVRILSQFSLIKMDGNSSRTYSMHRLVHQWMQDRLPKSSRSEMALLSTIILAQSANHGYSAEDHAHRRALLIHLTTFSDHVKHTGLVNQLSINTVQKLARVYYEGGKPADAEALLCQAISLLEKNTSETTEQHIDLLIWLAFVLSNLGRLREAEAFEREVLKWGEKHLGTNSVSTTVARNNLAATLHDLGELGQAKELKNQVLDWRKEYLGMDDADTYQAMINLAATLHDLGELGEAKELEIQVLDWRREYLGMDHPSTYRAMGHLAATFRGLGELEEAKKLEIQVLDWQERHLGMNHPDTCRSMANLAATLRGLGELGEAKELEIQVLEWWQKKHFGMNHPDTYRAMANLAATLRGLGELGEAKELEIEVLDWRKEHLGMDHPDTYWAMGNLACTLIELYEVSEAKGLDMQVLNWRKVHLGPQHRDTILATENLVDTLIKLGEISEAEGLLAQVEESRSTAERSRTDATDIEGLSSS
jgi:tetratricopeptide (TPR) repeat protein